MEKEMLQPDATRIDDMDFSSERIMAVHPRDMFGNVFYLYDPTNGKKKQLGRGCATAVFCEEFKDKAGLEQN